MQTKQGDCKMSTKKDLKKKNHFLIFLATCTHKNVKPRKSSALTLAYLYALREGRKVVF